MAKDKEKADDKETPETPEIIIVTDDEKALDAELGPVTDDTDLPAKAKVKAKAPAEKDDDEDEPDDAPEDARLGASEESEAEAEAKQSQHKSRRQRQKDAERRLRTERDFLERRNETLEKEVMGLKKRMDSTDKSTLEGRIANAKLQITRADKIHADAITAGKGDEASEALKIRDNLRDSVSKMEQRLQTAEREQDTPPPARPEVAVNARAWMKRTSWFDPQLKDQDSKLVRALDIAVDEAGFDPGTPEYFEELDRRIAEVLPHRASKKPKKRQDDADEDVEDEEDEDERPQKKTAKSNGKNGQRPAGGPRFRTGSAGRDLKSNEVLLSPARVAAMKEVGAWDDPALRQKYLKKYQDWDREHADELDR